MSTCLSYRANVSTEDTATTGVVNSQNSETSPGAKERLGSCRRREQTDEEFSYAYTEFSAPSQSLPHFTLE